MNAPVLLSRPVSRRMIGLLASLILFAGCDRPERDVVQGYVEGEFVYVASPLAGALRSLNVRRGMQVQAGTPLFELDSVPETAARDEAGRKLAEAQANLEDVKKGKRPSEIASLEAQLRQARVALALSDKELARQKTLMRTPGATAELEYLRAQSVRDQNHQRVAQLDADLKTARLGSRSDQITAAENNVLALEAALQKAQWDLSQKRQAAPQAALVFDTLYREGEWVPAGRPVIVLLPPDNVKVRAFVSQPRLGAVQHGDSIQVTVDGLAQPLIGKVSFISPRAEYTPPVIYSQEARSKLVFMIEAVFDHDTSTTLHPGQPVDVHLGTNHAR